MDGGGPVSYTHLDVYKRQVVEEFIDRDLPPIEFGTVVNDGYLWKDLVDLAAGSWRGRRYLDKVRSALRGGPESWWDERAKLSALFVTSRRV